MPQGPTGTPLNSGFGVPKTPRLQTAVCSETFGDEGEDNSVEKFGKPSNSFKM